MGILETKHERVDLTLFRQLQLLISHRIIPQILHNFTRQTDCRSHGDILGFRSRDKRTGQTPTDLKVRVGGISQAAVRTDFAHHAGVKATTTEDVVENANRILIGMVLGQAQVTDHDRGLRQLFGGNMYRT